MKAGLIVLLSFMLYYSISMTYLILTNNKKTEKKIKEKLQYYELDYTIKLQLLEVEILRYVKETHYIIKSNSHVLTGFDDDGGKIMKFTSEKFSGYGYGLSLSEIKPLYLNAEEALLQLKLDKSVEVIDFRTDKRMSEKELRDLL